MTRGRCTCGGKDLKCKVVCHLARLVPVFQHIASLCAMFAAADRHSDLLLQYLTLPDFAEAGRSVTPLH